ncbi:MAG: diguanylate cyclase [Thiobacillus sp.]|nr:diguanylate cyclase [Thiobacillus sp.]
MSDTRPRILAIDDTPANLMTLGAALASDYDLQVATSGEAGLELAAARPPDLILLDVMMPEMDGYETCGRLLADPLTRDVPIIFITAQNSPEDETRGLEAGAVDYITKPVNPAVVKARVRAHLTLKLQADQLRAMAFLDGLTGLANRRRFNEALDSEWRFARRTGAPLSLILTDIDHFKPFNDTYGHQAGDACLQAVAQVLMRSVTRSHDLSARYGGEEFVCLLPGTGLAGAQAKAESLRLGVQKLQIPHHASDVAPVVTVSLGVATVSPREGIDSAALVGLADAQLYEAKRKGRNRVCAMEISSV